MYLCQTIVSRLVAAIADMGDAQYERNAISKFLDDSGIKNLLQDARQSMDTLDQHARWLNEDRFVMYVWCNRIEILFDLKMDSLLFVFIYIYNW